MMDGVRGPMSAIKGLGAGNNGQRIDGKDGLTEKDTETGQANSRSTRIRPVLLIWVQGFVGLQHAGPDRGRICRVKPGALGFLT